MKTKYLFFIVTSIIPQTASAVRGSHVVEKEGLGQTAPDLSIPGRWSI